MKYSKTLLALLCTVSLAACSGGGDGEGGSSAGGYNNYTPTFKPNTSNNTVSKNKDVAEVDLANKKVTQFNDTSTNIDQLVINGKVIEVPKIIITSSNMINGVNKTSITEAYPDTGAGTTLRYGIVQKDNKFYVFHKGDLTSLADMQKINNGGTVTYTGHAYKLNDSGTDILDALFHLKYVPKSHRVSAYTISGEHSSKFAGDVSGNKFVSDDGKSDGAFYGKNAEYVGAKTIDKENNNYVVYGGMKLFQMPSLSDLTK